MKRAAQLGIPVSLIAAAQAGDSNAIALLIERAQPDVRRYARRTCRTASDIDDATQEALFIIYRRVGSLRIAGALSSWMFSIVDRVCLQLARRAFGVPAPLDVIENDGRFASLSDHDLRFDLAAAIQSLPAQYRDVLLLRDVEELTIDEIAERLTTGRQAVKARLHRARLLVREYILQ